MIEQIIAFLEEYWGYSIVGGVTLGTIITFIVTQIKSLISSSTFKKTIKNLTGELKTQYDEALKLLDVIKEKDVEKQALYNELSKARKEQQEANEYYNKVQAAQFKAFSYIIMASKLTEGDKLELLEEFEKLKLAMPVAELPTAGSAPEEIVVEVNSFDEALKEAEAQQDVVKEQLIESAKAVEDVVEKAKTLFEKYTKER